ncbi:hypothetical protein [Microbacterium sp. LWH12-1.2]|uniref:hypothetical protein n=1 Tax=Microbacterium sp. LWH12-1.2 TaxID=3135259 RepID=UPI0034126755
MSFFALTVFGLGAMSVATDTDIIAVPGLGQSPGIVGMLAALVVFATTLSTALRRQHPTFLAAPVTALTTALVHLMAVWFATLVSSGDLVIATVVAGGLVQGGPSLVLLLAAAIAAWGGIALRRTRAEHPRWPWERDEDE